jgi:predicted PurR-regulated permease PerM
MSGSNESSRAEDAADDAVEARDEAAQATAQALAAKDAAEEAANQAEATLSDEERLENELLIHPDNEPDHDSPHPFGRPGQPMSRRSPFYVGFVGACGVLVAILLGLALKQVGSVLILVIVAAFLAVGLNPLVEWLMHRGLRRPWAVTVVSLGVLGVVTIFIVALVPVLRDQITALIESVPTWLDDLRDNRTIQDLDDKYDIIDTVNDKVQSADFAQTAFGSVFSVGLAVLNALFNAFLIFVLTLYFLGALPNIKRACYSLAPASRRTRVTYLGDEILRRVGGYVFGAFVVALCAGISSFLFLEIVGLGEYAVALALVVAILDFIPLIGATLGAVVVSVIGFATSIGIGIACVIFFIVYQQLENYVIYPRVMRQSLNVPGLVTVIAVLIGGSLMGVVGAMLAIPTVAAGMLLVREVFLRRQDTA